MPPERDWVLWSYDDERDGQIAVGTLNGPWMDVTGVSKVLISSNFANSTGTTAIALQQSRDGITVDKASSDVFTAAQGSDGVELNVAWPYARVVITQGTAATTSAELFVKGSD